MTSRRSCVDPCAWGRGPPPATIWPTVEWAVVLVGNDAAGTNTYSLDVRGEFLPAMTIFETDLPYALYRTGGSSRYGEFVVWCSHAEQATSVPIHSIPFIDTPT